MDRSTWLSAAKVNDAGELMLLKEPRNKVRIRGITPHERVVVSSLNAAQIHQVAGVGELVQVDKLNLRVAAYHAQQEVRANKAGAACDKYALRFVARRHAFGDCRIETALERAQGRCASLRQNNRARAEGASLPAQTGQTVFHFGPMRQDPAATEKLRQFPNMPCAGTSILSHWAIRWPESSRPEAEIRPLVQEARPRRPEHESDRRNSTRQCRRIRQVFYGSLIV